MVDRVTDLFRVQVHTLFVVKAENLMNLSLRGLGVLNDGDLVLHDAFKQFLNVELLASDVDLVTLDLRVILAAERFKVATDQPAVSGCAQLERKVVLILMLGFECVTF